MTSSAGWSAAAHLVRSTGFGASGDLVDAVAAAGPSAWLQASLRAAPDSDPGAAAAPPPTFEAVAPLGQDASTEQKQQRRKQVADQVTQLTAWWIRRMVAVQNPVVEKLTFGWHNHFATSATKVRSAPMLLAQNATLRAKGRGSFTDLADAMVVDPALLFWLDGQQNTVKAPNENLSREFMELFTLGRSGGYTEQDVREGARALTGWTLDRSTGSAAFVARRHDAKPKTLLGTTADLDAPGFVRVLLDQTDLGAVRRDTVVAAPRRARGSAGRRPRPRGRGVRVEPRPHRAVPDDADRRRVCGDHRLAGRLTGRVGRRGDALPPRDDRRRHGDEGGRRDARTRPAAVLPAQRQRLAGRPGVAVHGVGDDPGADGRDARPGR